MSDGQGIRASDAERDQTAAALREHYAAGRLTADELDERIAAVYRASTLAELRRLRSDLPDLPLPASASRAELARRQAELRRQLVQSAGGALTPFAICTAIWAASGADSPFWPVWLLIFPVLFLARNAWRLYGPAPELERVERELARRSHRRRHGTGSGPHRGELG